MAILRVSNPHGTLRGKPKGKDKMPQVEQAPEDQARAFARRKAEEFQQLLAIGDHVMSPRSEPEQIKAREKEEE